MSTTSDKLKRALITKKEIREAIISKGVDFPEDLVFSKYPEKIQDIETGGGGSEKPIKFSEYVYRVVFGVFKVTQTIEIKNVEKITLNVKE